MHETCGCQGASMQEGRQVPQTDAPMKGDTSSQLRQWPLQLHLVGPQAPYFQGADLLLAADCVAYALGNFHAAYLQGRSLAIACPKLDEEQDSYVQKLKALLEEAKINTLTVMIMEVPCCTGLLNLARRAMEESSRKVPMKLVIVGRDGGVRQDAWVN